MIDGSEVRGPQAPHPVDELFLDRWSPRAMSGDPLTEEELTTLFEAARWAPSSYNNQPWRILYARRETGHWETFLSLLVEGNRAWAKDAAALLLFVSKETFDFNGQPYPTHSFDTGAAWENLALQATMLGLVTHGMQGFDYERARTELNVPEGFRVEAMIAVGRPGDPAQLPEGLRAREAPSGRKPLSEITCEGAFNF
ncbi:MAG: nitroreductase family protein [Acidobacteria bacterium]|nr:nitroreductase family protein [Acidobacteriota bacterium]